MGAALVKLRVRQSYILVMSAAAGLGFAVAQASAIEPAPTPTPAPSGPCCIPAVPCDLGTGPRACGPCACEDAETRDNTCFGLHPFQIPVYGYVNCPPIR